MREKRYFRSRKGRIIRPYSRTQRCLIGHVRDHLEANRRCRDGSASELSRSSPPILSLSLMPHCREGGMSVSRANFRNDGRLSVLRGADRYLRVALNYLLDADPDRL